MAKRKLNWVPGDACNGKHYYLHAWHDDVKFTLTKIIVGGRERFEVWRGKEFHGIFDVRLDAIQFAEGLVA